MLVAHGDKRSLNPCLMANFKVLHQKLVGEKHLKLMLEPLYKGFPTNVMIDGIAFNVDLRRWPDASVKTVRLAYKLDINEFAVINHCNS